MGPWPTFMPRFLLAIVLRSEQAQHLLAGCGCGTIRTAVMGVDAASIEIRMNQWNGVVDKAGFKWTNRPADQLVKRGDVIDISDDDGVAVARGLSEYDAVDAARICGHRSSELADILGTVPRSVLVHRDQLVLL